MLAKNKRKKPQIQTAVNISEILDFSSKRMSKFRTLLYLITMSITSKADIQLFYQETALIAERYFPCKQMGRAANRKTTFTVYRANKRAKYV